jgi:asparagine synthase (glutamine-hydrolysing)
MNHILLGHNRLSIIDPLKGIQPMTYNNYVIIYNGELYNTNVIRNMLIKKGYEFDTTCDTEVLLKAYIHFKEKVLSLLEGIYAFAIYDGNKLFIARDCLGVKPLFYTKVNNNFMFASELKALLKNKLVKPIINRRSLQELLALGPSRSPGSGIFKSIYELKPGHYLIYQKNKLKIKRYWNVKDNKFNDSFEECTKKVRSMLESAIKRQMVSDVDIATFLSGGLDSSIITGICSKEKNKRHEQLTTYSIDYEDNEKYFNANDFQVSQDSYYIELMKDKFKTNHHYEIISQSLLADTLKEAVKARDLPGMADIDSSLYWFSTKIKEDYKVVLSGECADEVFGGYPWFYKEELLNKKGFPWISNLKEREELLNKNIRRKLRLEKYAYKQYKNTIKEAPKCRDKKEKKHRNLFYLNMVWFMTTLLERKDRMTMMAGLEARVPFADHKLIEYLWNVPWKYKYYNNMEKGLLREAFKDLLPEDIIKRKKNPYPKTHHPSYANIVSNLLEERLKDKSSILYKVFDIDKIKDLIQTNGTSFTKPWFGQLMTGPQLIAYLYQFDIWAKEYNIILKI